MTQVANNKLGGFYMIIASSLEKANQILKTDGKEAMLFERPHTTDTEKMTHIAQLNIEGRSVAIVFLCRESDIAQIHEKPWLIDQILLLTRDEKWLVYNLSNATLVQCPDGKTYWRLRDNEKRAGRDFLLELDQAM